jgi:hypothetical protein
MKVNFRTRQWLICLLIITFIASTQIIVAAKSTESVDETPIDSISELKKEIEEARKSGKNLSKKEAEEIIENTESEVLAEFTKEQLEKAIEVVDDIEVNLEQKIDGTYYQKETMDLGYGGSVEVELIDREDPTILEKIASSLIEPTYATVNHQNYEKEYGNRYFTAKISVNNDIYSTLYLKLENHYNLSKDGIKERYGTPSSSGGNSLFFYVKGTPKLKSSTYGNQTWCFQR